VVLVLDVPDGVLPGMQDVVVLYAVLPGRVQDLHRQGYLYTGRCQADLDTRSRPGHRPSGRVWSRFNNGWFGNESELATNNEHQHTTTDDYDTLRSSSDDASAALSCPEHVPP
jgi:hypothetical protein